MACLTKRGEGWQESPYLRQVSQLITMIRKTEFNVARRGKEMRYINSVGIPHSIRNRWWQHTVRPGL